MSGANVRIGANSSEFQRQMSAVTKELKVIQSEFGLASKKAELFGNESEKLGSKQAELSNKLKSQNTLIDMNKNFMQLINDEITKQNTKQTELKTKIEEVNKAYQDSVNEKGKDSEETKKLKQELDKLKEEYAKNEKAIENSNKKLDTQKIKLNDAEKGLLETKKALQDVNKELSTVKFEQISKNLQKTSEVTGNIGRNLGTNVTIPLIAAGVGATKLASDLEESMNKVDVAFGKSSDKVEKWSEDTLESYGIAKGTALDVSSTFGDMATSMGVSQSKAADMSMSLVGLAGDLSSFKNINVEQAQTALNGIFTGETESLKQLGIVMTETNLQQYAYSQGIKTKVKDMTEAEKVQLRYNFVLEKTKNANGDFERTGGGAANQFRIFSESIKEVGASFGEHILPVITPVIAQINESIKAFGNLDGTTQKTILVLAGVAAAVGPTLMGISNLAMGLDKTVLIVGKAKAAFSGAGGLSGVLTALTGPVGITIGVIVALIAIGVLLWKNWDTIKEKATQLGQWMSNTWNSIKESTLNAWNGIKNGLSTAWNNIKSLGTQVFNSISSTISSIWNNIKSATSSIWNGIKSTASSVWNGIKSAIQNPISTAVSFVKTQLDKLKGFFSGLNLKLPNIKVPHFSIKGSFSLNPPRIPSIGIEWYRDGGILTKPTAFGMNGNNLMVGGEAGSEAVIPLNKLPGLIGMDKQRELTDTLISMLRGGEFGSGITLHIENFFNNTDKDIESLANELAFFMNRKTKF